MTRGEKRKTGDAATCTIFDNFSSKFLFKSVGRQLATFARILDAKYFFHSPWQPKWSQLGALNHCYGELEV